MFSIRSRTRGYDGIFQNMIDSVPAGTFYDFTRPIVMWRRDPVEFYLESDRPNVPVRISLELLGNFGLGVDQSNRLTETMIVPQNFSVQTLFSLTLGRGLNRITAEEILPTGGGRKITAEFIATTNTILFESMCREIARSTFRAEQVQSAIYSPYSTRLLDQLASIGDVLPDLQTLKTLSTKMIIRSFVHFPSQSLGVRNLIEAVTLNRPVWKPQRGPSVTNLETDDLMRVLENEAGMEAHVWYPNLSVTRWLAFWKMASNFRDDFQIVSIRDDQIKVIYQGLAQEHRFDYDGYGQNFLSNVSLEDCFSSITATMSANFVMRLQICSWTYPFDTGITAETAIGLTRPYLDSGVPFDSGIPFDADPVDPFSDGFIGFTYSGRFEMDYPPTSHPLDSMVQPAWNWSGPPCSYEGPYSQMLNSVRSDMDIDAASSVLDFEMNDDYVAGAIVGLYANLPNSNVGVESNQKVFVAGQTILICVKYVDSNQMTNSSGTGNVLVTDPVSGVDEWAIITPAERGFVYCYITPTAATPSTQFTLDDGIYTGFSEEFSVVPDVFAGLTVTSISNQTVGDSFTLTVQAVDQFGNPTDETGGNNQLAILPLGGFDAADPTPKLHPIVNGQAVISLTMSQPGTGQLRFQIGSIWVDSDAFTVS